MLTGKHQNDKEVDELIRKIDVNDSGAVDYTGTFPTFWLDLIEFVTATINRNKILSTEKLESAFSLFDKVLISKFLNNSYLGWQWILNSR